jgi:hypothetical protein
MFRYIVSPFFEKPFTSCLQAGGSFQKSNGGSPLNRICSGLFGLAIPALFLSACAPSSTLDPTGGAPAPTTARPAPGATQATIDAADLGLRVGILAADSMRGRETGTPGAAAAARYLVAELTRLGLRPAGDAGSYLQAVPLERTITTARVSVSGGFVQATLGPGEILPVSGLGGLPRANTSGGGGQLVFGGHLIDPTLGSSELNLADVRDAVVIVRLGPAPGVDAATASPRPVLASLFSPISPASAIILVAEESEEDFWDYAADIGSKGSIALAGSDEDQSVAPPFFLVTTETAEALIGASLSEAREPRRDLGTMEFAIDTRVEAFDDYNVVAIAPGGDPARAGEYVTIGAHYDHVGVGAPVEGDSIYNGADDNASGTSGLLEIAEAIAHLPEAERPDRSVLMVWNAAEESGLLGSEHFTDHPTVDRPSIIAHVNVDMIGRNHPDSIFSVGSRRLSTELGDLVEAVNQRQERPFIFDFSLDAPGHPEQIYCRSDHYNYARYGIPIVFLTTGLHDDYHAPSDHAGEIDNEKLARVSSLVFDIVMELADRPTRPRIDQPVPPLDAPCT